jgi:hypothetical protein
MRKKILFLLMVTQFTFNCAKAEDIAEMTAPVAFAIANNAIKNGKKDGRLNVDLSFQNIEKKNLDWPSGTIVAKITTPDSHKSAIVTYILNNVGKPVRYVQKEKKGSGRL